MALIKALLQEREGALPLLLVMVIICSQTFLRKQTHLPAFILCLENVQQASLRYFLFFSSSSIFKKAVFPSPSVSGEWHPSGEGSTLWEIRWHTWKVLITQLNVTKCMELTQSHQGSKRSFLKTLHIISISYHNYNNIGRNATQYHLSFCFAFPMSYTWGRSLHQGGYDDFNSCPSQKSYKVCLSYKIQSKPLGCSHWLRQCWHLLLSRGKVGQLPY